MGFICYVRSRWILFWCLSLFILWMLFIFEVITSEIACNAVFVTTLVHLALAFSGNVKEDCDNEMKPYCAQLLGVPLPNEPVKDEPLTSKYNSL